MYLTVETFLKAASALPEGGFLPQTDIRLYRQPKDGLENRLRATLQSISDSHSGDVVIGGYAADGWHPFMYRASNCRSGRYWFVAGQVNEAMTTAKNIVVVAKSRYSESKEVTAFWLDESQMIADAIIKGLAWSIGEHCLPLSGGTVSTTRKPRFVEFNVVMRNGTTYSGSYVPQDWVQHGLDHFDMDPVRQAIAWDYHVNFGYAEVVSVDLDLLAEHDLDGLVPPLA